MEHSAKHGRLTDEQLKHETEPIERGAPQRSHTEEWREVEPVGRIPAERPESVDPTEQDIGLRAELARVLTRDDFPATPDELTVKLDDADVPAELVGRVAALSSEQRFQSAHEVMVALGINAPEQR
ncbi:MAG: DUF2795 domain-containing protein [Streptosporangiaceae bacterium]|nr:DUF2795 domain-containing protein [Streptosporangiaceae bacterium]